MTTLSCPICGSDNVVETYRLYDDRYGYEDDFQACKCKACQHIFIKHDFTGEDIERLYTEYYPRKELDVEQVKPLAEATGLKSWLAGSLAKASYWSAENVKLLDIGCGMGESLLYHKNRGCEVQGTETDNNVSLVAKHFDLKIHIGDFNKDNYVTGSFDVVIMEQVIEHLLDPHKTLVDIAGVMKSDGSLIVSTPNACGWGMRLFGKKWINWHTPYHLHIFSSTSMRALAKTAGMKIVESHQVTASDWLYYQCMHLISYPDKGKKSPFWQNQSSASRYQNILRRCFNILSTLYVFAIITRIFDASGYGDNQVFILKKSNV